ncbi:hypothetical protein AAFC00_003329 [Neodothiora populina]|uniref:ubiquitinyl hydrolase 1 n=1 Tax=Neodothiora populina TaxID=2781224 RepID=A0ABR3PA23_9PEZI
MMDMNSDMLVDSDYDDKAQDVTIITPDDESMDDQSQDPLADDFEAMRERWMPYDPDLEVEAEAIDTWDVKDWRTLPKRTHGPTFECGNDPWRILFFPAGNNASDSVSFYLEHGYTEDIKAPENWYSCVRFMLVLWNPKDPSIYIHHEANHRFTLDEGDWGFTRFAEKNKVFAVPYEDKARPLVENDCAKVTAYVRVLKDPTGVLWHNFVNYDSKKETGMVGLRNQGATCYLNSLLQSLYFTNSFRKAVYQIPTENEQDAASSSAWALQRLFYKLQTDPVAVSTMELTRSFGWESRQVFEQQDVQELSRILMDKMEEKMKGTAAENALADMFVGKMKTYIRCINVDFESSRVEDFWDLQLNVSGCKSLKDSLENYIEVETLEGDNKYQAEGFGLQDAKKGVIFESFPQVLHLQLKRFEYDFVRDMMVKVNDRYEFPETFDASPYLSDTADKSEPYIYHLHGVLVHSGDMNAGHYYAFLKPSKDSPFYKFDDDRVTRATKKEAMDENFGGEYSVNGVNGMKVQNPFTRQWSTKRSMSAYMLVYIRESRLDQILPPSDSVQPPEHLPKRLNEERAIQEKRRKEREEAHLYMNVQVATKEHFKNYQGFDIVEWKPDEENDPAAPKTLKCRKAATLTDFVKQAAEAFSIEPDMIRPWIMVNRQNGTVRPDHPLLMPGMTLEEANQKFSTRQAHFRIFLEQAESRDEAGLPVFEPKQPAAAPAESEKDKPIIIFLKYFDMEKQELKGVGHTYMFQSNKVSDLAQPILKKMGWGTGVHLKLYEEIKHNYIDVMKPVQSLLQSELQDGDIVCFQTILPEAELSAFKEKHPSFYTEPPAFYDYLLNRQEVTFIPKPGSSQALKLDEDKGTFPLYLSKKDSYDAFTSRVAAHLSQLSGTPVDPTHIRFSTMNANNWKARAVVKRVPNATLNNILAGMAGYGSYGYSSQANDALYYEVMEMSLAELEQRKNIRISWLTEGIQKEEIFDILAPKAGRLGDALAAFQQRARLPDEVMEQIRFYETHSSRIFKKIDSTHPISEINEFMFIYGERIPEEELSMNPEAGDKLISCFHFDKEPSKAHNIPFFFVMKEGEIFKETKERLSKRTGIKGKQFEKIKFAIVRGGQSYSRPVYVEEVLGEDDILSDKLGPDDLLGLDHVNKTRAYVGKYESLNIR